MNLFKFENEMQEYGNPNIKFSIETDADGLNDIASAFLQFLNGCGFNYVKEVRLMTDSGEISSEDAFSEQDDKDFEDMLRKALDPNEGGEVLQFPEGKDDE